MEKRKLHFFIYSSDKNLTGETLDIQFETGSEILTQKISEAVEAINLSPNSKFRIAFPHYYRNVDLMYGRKLFPYIFRNGHYEWGVPFSEVTIDDFLKTNQLSEGNLICIDIELTEYYAGPEIYQMVKILGDWCDVYLYNWVLQNCNTLESLPGIASFRSIVFQSFHQNGRLITATDVVEAIQKRAIWTKGEFEQAFDPLDDNLEEALFYAAGFDHVSRDWVRFRETDFQDDVSDYLWGDYTEHNLLHLNCVDLNRHFLLLRAVTEESQMEVLYRVAEFVLKRTIIDRNVNVISEGVGIHHLEVRNLEAEDDDHELIEELYQFTEYIDAVTVYAVNHGDEEENISNLENFVRMKISDNSTLFS